MRRELQLKHMTNSFGGTALLGNEIQCFRELSVVNRPSANFIYLPTKIQLSVNGSWFNLNVVLNQRLDFTLLYGKHLKRVFRIYMMKYLNIYDSNTIPIETTTPY